jgi:hypothetical protein
VSIWDGTLGNQQIKQEEELRSQFDQGTLHAAKEVQDHSRHWFFGGEGDLIKHLLTRALEHSSIVQTQHAQHQCNVLSNNSTREAAERFAGSAVTNNRNKMRCSRKCWAEQLRCYKSPRDLENQLSS